MKAMTDNDFPALTDNGAEEHWPEWICCDCAELVVNGERVSRHERTDTTRP